MYPLKQLNLALTLALMALNFSELKAESQSQCQATGSMTPANDPLTIGKGPDVSCNISYDQSKYLGVCLWSGTGTSNDGWINAGQTSRCGQQVLVTDDNDLVHQATIVGGCNMSITDPSTGCNNLWVTGALFQKLAVVRKNGGIIIKKWSFV